MKKDQIQKTYNIIKSYYDKYLKQFGVKMPALVRNGQYTEGALVLIRLFQGYPQTQSVTKKELTDFVNKHRKDKTNDLQSGRHLGKQAGWYILAGTRDKNGVIEKGAYKLFSLEEPFPGFFKERRSEELTDEVWEDIKKEYGYRCACCGSKEGEPNFYSPTAITTLQKGHMDPNKALTADNTIPQCSVCNQPDRNWWVFDKTGRVIAVADPQIITRSNEDVQKAMYEILKEKYK